MNITSSFDLTSLRSNLPTSNSSSNRSEEQKQDENHGDSLFTTSSVEVVNPATPESLKLNSDCLRITLSFLNIKDAHSLNLVSKNQNNEVNQILNQTHSPKILPKNICIPFGGRSHTLKGINMQIEAREGFPSTQQLVNDAGQWDTAFIIHCLDKNRNKEGYINNKRTFLVYAVLKGDITLLKSLKDDFRLTSADVKLNHNEALRMAAKNGHVEVLRVLKHEFVLTAQDARAENNHALKMAAERGHVDVLRVLKNKFGLTSNDARAADNWALKWAALNGHVEVLRFLKYEFGLTAEDARADNNLALRWAARHGNVEVLRVLKNEFGLNADDAMSERNAALRWAAYNGHVEVLRFLKYDFRLTTYCSRAYKFFENEFGVTAEEPYDINCNCCTIT